MAGYIIGTPDFIKNLDKWLSDNKQQYADYIARNKAGIPRMFTQYSDILYRGMTVDDNFINQLVDKGIKFNAHTSWSKDEKVAYKFFNDPAYKVNNKSGIKILIKKKPTPANIVLDIHNFCMFMGESQLNMLGLDDLSYDSAIKEQEVLVKKGINITKKDVKVVS